jgi:DNA replication ATP-dependent helicase Dna2
VQGTGETQTENGIQIPAASSDSNPPGHEIEDEAMLSLFESYEERCAASDRLGSLVGGPREAASPRLFVVSATVENDPAGKKMQKLVAQPLTDNHPHRGATGRQHSESRPVPRLTVVLQDDWSTLNIQSGDIIRLIHCDSAGSYLPFESTFSEGSSMHAPSASFVVDAERNLCIHHPDVLVSGTSVANAFSCQRRVVLGERNRYSIHQPRTTRAALRGTLLHQLFQQLLLRQCCAADTSLQVTEADLRFAVRRYYAELYALGESEEDLVTYLQQATADLDTHVRSLCTDPNGVSLQVRGWSPFPNAHRMRIRHLFDVEESIWSPVFGLKGSIDVTAAVELDQRGGDSVHTMPITCLELKTGHREGFSGVAHRAQLILYALLLSERYRTSVLATVLLYMQCGQKADALALQGAAEQATESSLQMSFHLVPVPRPELVGIIMARNKLAQYLRFRGMMPEHDDDWLSQLGRSWMELPPPLQNQANMCSHCYVRDTCALLHRAIERGDADTSALPPAFAALTESLTETHLQYYRHWLALTRLEEEAAFANREEVWTLSPSRRALLGRCIGNLELVQVERTVALGGGRFAECFRHRFRTLPDSAGEHAASPSSLPKTACSSDTFEVPSVSAARWDLLPGDYVSISPYWTRPSKSLFPQGLDTTVPMDDWDPARQECAIAGGFVHQVKPLDHEIQVDLERDCGAWLERHPIPGCAAGAVRWRIDREELSAGFSTMYGNLEALLYPEAERIRRLVIDLEAPRFSHGKERSEISGSASLLSSERPTEIDADDLAWIQQQLAGTELNVEQQQAVERIMQAQDYTLLLGMPGTGKTATVACLIQLLVARGYSVLLASHTHSAVDNVLQRLIQNDFHAFIRLGTRSHIEPALWPYTLPAADSDQSDLQNSGHVRLPSLDAFTCRIEEASLVATTCLGASHPIFYRRRHFDYVIVDEASQIAQPVILGPLRFARRAFILVGDDKQLPPLARHPQAQAHGADESLFVRLCTAHPEAVTVLRRQYRMAADIMLLCNALVYQGAMECANDVTAQQTLPMSPKRPISDRVTPEWLQRVLDPSRRVLFLDTDAARGSALECRSGRESICNHFEARVVLRIVQALEAADIGTDRIGITSPLRAQVSLLQSHFHQSISTDWARAAPECRTIDQFQGRDKDILIVSLVRNNNDARIGQVLRDWRRLNVAMTRARCKLVFVGSIRTMRTSPFVERLIDLIRDKLHGLVPIEHLD